jgi:hypothetical protein
MYLVIYYSLFFCQILVFSFWTFVLKIFERNVFYFSFVHNLPWIIDNISFRYRNELKIRYKKRIGFMHIDIPSLVWWGISVWKNARNNLRQSELPFNPVLTIVLCTSHLAAAFNFYWTTWTICIEFYHLNLKELFGVLAYFCARNLRAFIKGRLQQNSDKMWIFLFIIKMIQRPFIQQSNCTFHPANAIINLVSYFFVYMFVIWLKEMYSQKLLPL